MHCVCWSSSFVIRYSKYRLKCTVFRSARDRLYTSESDVYRRQILTYKDGPRADRVNRPTQGSGPNASFYVGFLIIIRVLYMVTVHFFIDILP